MSNPGQSIEIRLLALADMPADLAAEIAEFVTNAPCGSHLQCPHFVSTLPVASRHRYLVAEIREGGRLRASAIVRMTRLAAGYALAAMRRGPVLADPSEAAVIVPKLAQALARAGACTALMDPRFEDDAALAAQAWFVALGARALAATGQGLHRSTALVDLSGDAAALSARFKQRARRQVKKAAKAGIEVRPAASLEEARAYGAILDRFNADRGLGSDSVPPIEAQWDMTRARGAFLLAFLGEELIGGHTMIASGPRAYWLTMASTATAPNLPKNYPLLAEAMRMAQAQGFGEYDMAGSPGRAELEDTAALDAAVVKRFEFKSAYAPRIADLMPPMVLPLRRPAHDLLFGLRQQVRRWKTRG